MEKKEEWLEKFGQRLRSEREKQNMTQQGLAVKARTKQDYIAQIERGARNPSLRTLLNILTALDVSADYLIYGVDISKDDKSDKDGILRDFVSFLAKRDITDICSYYEVVKYLSKYIEKHSDNVFD